MVMRTEKSHQQGEYCLIKQQIPRYKIISNTLQTVWGVYTEILGVKEFKQLNNY